MAEALQLVALQWGAVLMLVVAGLGIAAWLVPAGDAARLAWAPLLGAAALLALVASAATQVASSQSVWLVLLPVVVLSLAAFALALHRGAVTVGELAEVGWVAVAMIPAFLLSAGPYLAQGSAGPLNLYVTDAWFWYLPMAHFLQDHTTGQTVPLDAVPPELLISLQLPGGVRVGFDALHAMFASLVDVRLDKTLAPFLGAAYMTVSATVYCLGRASRMLSRPWALFAAALVGSSALLLPVYESSGPSLFAYGLLAGGLWFAWVGVARASWRHVVAAAVLLAALLTTYTESIPVYALALCLATAAALVRALASREDRRARLHRAGTMLGCAITIPVLAIVLTPPAAGRAFDYIDLVRESVESFVIQDWGITPENLPVWSLGVEHLFEARRFAEAPTSTVVLAYAAAFLITAVGVVGVIAWARDSRPWLVAGIIAAAGIAIWAAASADCNYCSYRGWTVAVPFAALAIAAGCAAIARRARRLPRGAAIVAGALVPVLIGAVMARSSIDLAVSAADSRTATEASLRGVTDDVRDFAGDDPVLLEGVDAGFHITPFFWANALPQLVADGGGRPVFSPQLRSWIQGGGDPQATHPVPYDYGLVVTRFGGLDTERETVGDRGRYVVQRRAPVDVSVQTPSAWAVEEDTPGRDAIPWLTGPVDLVVSSPDPGRVALTVELVGPQAPTAAVTAALEGRPLTVVDASDADGRRLCIELDAPRGAAAIVTLTPGFAPPVVLPGYVQPDVPTPPLPEELGIAGVRAVENATCASASTPAQTPAGLLARR